MKICWASFFEMALILAALVIGFDKGKRQIRAEAVRAGVASWVITDDYGTKEFRWKAVAKLRTE